MAAPAVSSTVKAPKQSGFLDSVVDPVRVALYERPAQLEERQPILEPLPEIYAPLLPEKNVGTLRGGRYPFTYDPVYGLPVVNEVGSEQHARNTKIWEKGGWGPWREAFVDVASGTPWRCLCTCAHLFLLPAYTRACLQVATYGQVLRGVREGRVQEILWWVCRTLPAGS